MLHHAILPAACFCLRFVRESIAESPPRLGSAGHIAQAKADDFGHFTCISAKELSDAGLEQGAGAAVVPKLALLLKNSFVVFDEPIEEFLAFVFPVDQVGAVVRLGRSVRLHSHKSPVLLKLDKRPPVMFQVLTKSRVEFVRELQKR